MTDCALQKPWGSRDIPTLQLSAAMLVLTNLAACLLTAIALMFQNRRTK